jgi:hypothetical protein
MFRKKINSVLIARLLSALVLVSTLAMGMTIPAYATLSDGSTFDASNGDLTSGTFSDWNNPIETITCPSTIPGSGINCGTDLTKSTSDNAFGQGTKEDSPIPTVVSGSIPPNKSDLMRFYINKEFINGKFFIYLAWERSNVLGNANMDFEINQVRTDSGNGVTPVRTPGDLLITFDFTNGGGNPVLGLLTWITSDNGTASDCFASNSLPCWGKHQDLSSTGEAEGSVNTVTVTDNNSPLVFGTGELPALTFGEAAVDLTDSGIFQSDVCTHFGDAYLKSRSSSSFTSELKDFIAPVDIDISNCGNIIIRKVTVPSPDPTTTSFAYTTTGGLTPSTFSLKDGEMQDYENAVFAGSYSVSETDPAPTFVLQSLDCSASSIDNGSSFTIAGAKVSIDLKADDTIDCTYTNALQLGAIEISKTTTKGDAPLANATFSISGPSGTFSVKTDATGTVCKDNLLFGSYDVQETAAPTGYQINDTSVHTVSVDTQAACGSGNEVPLSFSDTPLSKITVSFQSLAGSGVTTATIECTGDSGYSNLPESTPKVLNNLVPGTYSCTVVVDP